MTMLEVLCIHGVDICPSLSCLVRLTRLELLLDLCCPQMAVPHSTLLMLQDWPQLRSLDLSWASPEPVMFGDTLTRLTQLEDVSLNLRDCSGLEQLPPHVTALSLQTSGVLDMAAMSCLQCCSSLRRLRLDCNTGVCTDLVDWCTCAKAHQEWLRGLCVLYSGSVTGPHSPS